MIFALGTCSAAHFNPAVTVAIVCAGRGKRPPAEAGAYIGVRLLGGICAAVTYAVMKHGQTFPLGLQKNFGWISAGAAEVVFTLCFAPWCSPWRR